MFPSPQITASLLCVTLYSFQREPRRPSVQHGKRSPAGATVAFLFVLLCCGFTLTVACAITETKSNLCSLNPLWMAAFSAAAFAFTGTFFLTKTALEMNFDLTPLRDMNAIDCLLVLGMYSRAHLLITLVKANYK